MPPSLCRANTPELCGHGKAFLIWVTLVRDGSRVTLRGSCHMSLCGPITPPAPSASPTSSNLIGDESSIKTLILTQLWSIDANSPPATTCTLCHLSGAASDSDSGWTVSRGYRGPVQFRGLRYMWKG
jgi:hypothetical protein